VSAGQSWADWLDDQLWDLERKASNAWWRARSAFYQGSAALSDLLGRRGRLSERPRAPRKPK
jgi:hypothetical protein